MSVEVRALGVACQLSCTYCYQNALRDAGNIKTQSSIDLIMSKLDQEEQDFSLFGGEPLLIPKEDMETLFGYGMRRFQHNSIQTNGALIDDDHIRMFKEYNVSVGVSIDGPGDLNDLRVYKNSIIETRKATQRTIDNIERMVLEGISVSVIFTLHKMNGTVDKLPKLMQFIRWLGDIGVTKGNLHMLEVDSALVKELYTLTEEENQYAFVTLAKFIRENNDLTYLPFADMKKLLLFDDENTMCIFRFCDPSNTQAVKGIEGNGDISNCSRTNKEGVDFYKADGHGFERHVTLWNTPQEYGGCQGCEYFSLCGGSCPGESIDGDYRNRTIHCSTLKAIYSHLENEIIAEGGQPVTKNSQYNRLQELVVDSLANGRRPLFKDLKPALDAGEVPPWAIVVPIYEEEV